MPYVNLLQVKTAHSNVTCPFLKQHTQVQYMFCFTFTLRSIMVSFSLSTDGAYTIFDGTANEARVFCDMTGSLTGCGGGGWTLVMRIDGHKVLSLKNVWGKKGCREKFKTDIVDTSKLLIN